MKYLGTLAVMMGMASASFGVTDPQRAFKIVRTEVESQIDHQVLNSLPKSMHAHFITAMDSNLFQGKYLPHEFSDFMGNVGVTAKLQENYYQFNCAVHSTVRTIKSGDELKPDEKVLEDEGPYGQQLVGSFHVGCNRTN